MASMAFWTVLALIVAVASGLKDDMKTMAFRKLLKSYQTKAQECGCAANKVSRIVGGTETSVNQYPWLVALVTPRGQQFCGGSIISNSWILTAAHCIVDTTARQVLVFANGHNLYEGDEPYPEIRKVSRIIMDRYNNVTNRYDIALLKLESPFTFSKGIKPVCLPYPGNDFEGLMAKGSGWGLTSEDGQQSEMPKHVDVEVLNDDDCESLYSNYGIDIYPEMMCAGYLPGGKDTCQGDSGGPLVVNCADNKFLQAGVVSWGVGCARPNTPGVYTKTAQYAYWIHQQTNGASLCFTDCE